MWNYPNTRRVPHCNNTLLRSNAATLSKNAHASTARSETAL
jgi:hypothetical protein